MKIRSVTMEALEDRALFCATSSVDTSPIAAMSALLAAPHDEAAVNNPLAGAFNVSGYYSHPIGPIGNPDAGSHYTFKGTGKTAALGAFTMWIDLTAPGLIANGHSAGTGYIKTAHGGLTLFVKGPTQDSGVLPPSLTFWITKGTGNYLNSTGKGGILVSASSTTQKFLFRFNQTA